MQRMKRFGATVSATLLCGAGTWTLTEERAAKVRGAQRRKGAKTPGVKWEWKVAGAREGK